jgi:hypothetical protein
MMLDPNRKLCGARLAAADFDRIRQRALRQGDDPDLAVKTRLRHSGFCERRPLPGSDRCQWHGGYSTGALTPQGKARALAGRAAWLAARKAAGLPLTMGRKAGGKNRPREEIEAEQVERRLRRQERVAKLERRRAARHREQEAAELDAGRERFHRGGQFWSDDELISQPAPAPPSRHSPPIPAPVTTTMIPDQVAVGADINAALKLAMLAIQQADAEGIHLAKDDILNLEQLFIVRLQVGDLPIETAERIYRLLERHEQRIDQGELEDLNRRARLEEAWAQFLASARSVSPRQPENRLPATENRPPVPSPPREPSVDNSGDNANRTAVDPYEFAQMVKAAGQARGRAFSTLAPPEPRRNHSIAPWARKRL